MAQLKDSLVTGSLRVTDTTMTNQLNLNGMRIFYGTCSVATAEKAVVCPGFIESDLVAGTAIYVTFTVNNSGAVGSLTMSVNGTTAKPIKCLINGALANLPAAGYILLNETYLFFYDGTNWVTTVNRDNDTYTKTRQQLRTTANENRPILFSGALTSVTTSNQDVITYRNNDIYVNAGEKLIYLQGKPVVFGEYSASTAPSSPVSGQVWLKQADMTIEEAKVLVIAVNSISSLPTTISNASITNDMQVINYEISNPGALNENIDYVTSNGSITLSGSLTGTTSLTLWLARCR